jgi:hypothetical protein
MQKQKLSVVVTRKPVFIMALAFLCAPAVYAQSADVPGGNIDNSAIIRAELRKAEIVETTSVTPNTQVNGVSPAVHSLRDKILQNYKKRMQNMKDNQSVRNNLLQNRLQASSSDTNKTLISNSNVNGNMSMSGAKSFSTLQSDAQSNKINLLADQAEIALNNLLNIRNRIDSRIQKEQSAGNDMTKAISLLATADSKIAVAQSDLTSLNSLASTTITTGIDPTTRQLINDTQTSILDAQKALNDVVTEIVVATGNNSLQKY